MIEAEWGDMRRKQSSHYFLLIPTVDGLFDEGGLYLGKDSVTQMKMAN